MKVLETYITLQAAGIPSKSAMAELIAAGSTSSDDVRQVYTDLGAITNLFADAAVGNITWAPSTTDPGDLDVLFLVKGLGEESNSVILTMMPLANVVSGQTAPNSYEQDGVTYYIVGKVLLEVNILAEAAYIVVMDVAVAASDITPDQFPNNDWDKTFEPVLWSVSDTIDEAYLPPGAVPSEPKGGGAHLHPTAKFLANVSKPVQVVVLIIKIAKVVKTILEHPTAFQVLIVNFSNQDIEIGSSYLYNPGQKDYADTLGQRMDNLNGITLPKPMEVVVTENKSFQVLQFISIGQVSDNQLKGTGMSFISEAGDSANVASMINIPWGSHNKIAVTSDYSGSAEQYWNQEHGESSEASVTTTLSDGVEVAMSIDALSGKQPSGDGKEAYFYDVVYTYADS